jgi:hypothetical protein
MEIQKLAWDGDKNVVKVANGTPTFSLLIIGSQIAIQIQVYKRQPIACTDLLPFNITLYTHINRKYRYFPSYQFKKMEFFFK